MMDKETANELLVWAEQKNPGKWIEHSYNVAKTAETIAKYCSLDNNLSYIFGLLHDIGRYEGITHLRHIFSGYNLMKNKGYNNIAKICLTHSFPYKNINSYQGEFDCSLEEIIIMERELDKMEYDDYDKLIQLCDAISSDKGITLMEIRLVDVVKRNGFNEFTLNKWNAFFEIKNYFEMKCGRNIYKIFKEEIIENVIGKSSQTCT